MTWKCTEQDLPWLMELAEKSYGQQMTDAEASLNWAKQALKSPKVLIVRTNFAALVAVCAPLFFDPLRPVATVQFFAGAVWHIPSLFDRAKAWSIEKGAEDWLYFRATTGYDISALAERLGAEPDYPGYKMRLKDV